MCSVIDMEQSKDESDKIANEEAIAIRVVVVVVSSIDCAYC